MGFAVYLYMAEIPHFMTKVDENTPPEVVFAMLLAAQRAHLSSLEKQVLLEDENALLKKKMYGKSSEKWNLKKNASSSHTMPMLQIFDETVISTEEATADIENEEVTSEPILENADLDSAVLEALSESIDNKASTAKRGRKRLPNHFIRENVIHDLSDAEKQCACGCQLSKIGEEVSEQLEVIPAQLKVLRHVRYKYACRGCEDGVKIALVPAQPIPKGIPTAGLLSHVCVAKYDDHLPLYRQAEIWQRLGVDLSRSTLSSWVLQVGALLQPLIPFLQSHLVKSGYVKADETTTQVLREPGRVATSTSYMWLYSS
jgi:transposase